MTPRQKRNQRRWQINSKNFRNRQKQNKQLLQQLTESTLPDSNSDAPIQEIAESPTFAQEMPLTRSQGGENYLVLDIPGTSRQCDSPKSDTSLYRQLRYNANKSLMLYRQQLVNLKKQNEMLRKRIICSNIRLKKQNLKSPRNKAEHLLSDPNKKEDVKKPYLR